MITAKQAFDMMQREERLEAIESSIDARITETVRSGWKASLVIKATDYHAGLQPGDFEIVVKRYRECGWRISDVQHEPSGAIAIEFENPAKQYERGGPNDR